MNTAKMTADDIRASKAAGRRLATLTAYDCPTTRMLDALGIPLVLVGDSLGMVVLGYEDTTSVTMDDMLHHVRACARAQPRALLVADLPYGSYVDTDTALTNARRLVDAGADAVKAEGGRDISETVRAIVDSGIPFMGHLGMLPQSIKEEGGYSIKGKSDEEEKRLLADAQALVDAGAFAVVLELVHRPVAKRLTDTICIPTIGIGAGDDCDGQILVTQDLLRVSPDYIPKHVPSSSIHVGEAMRTVVQEWKTKIEQS